MKIDSRPAPKPTFNPINVTITIESADEMLALQYMCDHQSVYIPEHHWKSVVARFFAELRPHVTGCEEVMQYLIDMELRNRLLAYMEQREDVRDGEYQEVPNLEMLLANELRDLKPLRECGAHAELAKVLQVAYWEIRNWCDEADFMSDETAELLRQCQAALAKYKPREVA